MTTPRLPTKLPDGAPPIPLLPMMKWDKEAKRKDGSWDIDRVIRSTRFECPHCGGHLRDEHRLWLDKHGMWLPTREGGSGHVGHQLASFYAPIVRDIYGQETFESKWGGMAAKFLEELEKGNSGGWINSDLAEVNANQQHGHSTVEISNVPLAQPDWIPLLTADFHKNHPYLWFTARKWCAFKLAAPIGLTNGKPDFVTELDLPGNESSKKICDELVGNVPAAWYAVGELARFNTTDPATGRSPLIDFLLAKKITGEKLVKFFRDPLAEGGAGGDTMEFRRQILLQMFKLAGGDEKQFRASRGGDSELIAAGYCDRSGEYAWDELTEIIAEFKIGQGLRIPGARRVH